MTDQPPVSPTQADRDALANHLDPDGIGQTSDWSEQIRRGEQDDHPLLQLLARHRLSAIAPGGVDRNAILCAARAWWAAHMPNSTVRAINIQGDGRVKIAWRDHEESGHYTLPVDFLSLPQAPAGGEAKLREALIKARNQFAFYAREHEAAGKVEKAQTNSRYAEMIDDALAEPAPVGDGRAEDDWVHCSFCERAATTDVDDKNGPMPACASCYAAWQLDPGFSGNDPDRAQVDGEGSK